MLLGLSACREQLHSRTAVQEYSCFRQAHKPSGIVTMAGMHLDLTLRSNPIDTCGPVPSHLVAVPCRGHRMVVGVPTMMKSVQLMLHCAVRQPLSSPPVPESIIAQPRRDSRKGTTFERKGKLRECWHPECEAWPTRVHMQMQRVGTSVHKIMRFAWFSESSQRHAKSANLLNDGKYFKNLSLYTCFGADR